MKALRRKSRTNRMLMMMGGQFALCWAPSVLINILRDLGAAPPFVQTQPYACQLVTHALAMSTTLWNPILYALLNDSFRAAFIRLLPGLKPRPRPPPPRSLPLPSLPSLTLLSPLSRSSGLLLSHAPMPCPQVHPA